MLLQMQHHSPRRICAPVVSLTVYARRQNCRHVGRQVRRRSKHDGTQDAEPQSAELEAFETSRGVVAPLPVEQAEVDYLQRDLVQLQAFLDSKTHCIHLFDQVDYLGESTVGNLHFMDGTLKPAPRTPPRIDLADVEKVLATPFKELKAATRDLINELSVSTSSYPGGDPRRAIFCSRTLNLRSIQAIGFDMDYTLIVYDEIAWEGKAYEYSLRWLREQGLPVDGLQFDPSMVIRGLILDKELGNLVKVDRFGYVKRAMHGTRMMSWGEIHATYGRELVNLKNESRYMFLNTLFSVSEAVLFCQLVDRLDDGEIGPEIVGHSYPALYKLVSKALFKAHVEGKLKTEIIQELEKNVE